MRTIARLEFRALAIGILLVASSCHKDEEKPTRDFAGIGGVYEYSYKISMDGDFWPVRDSCRIQIFQDGTIKESRTSSDKEWTARLSYIPGPDSMRTQYMSYFQLQNIQSNTDPSQALLVKYGNDGFLGSNSSVNGNGMHAFVWAKYPYTTKDFIANLIP